MLTLIGIAVVAAALVNGQVKIARTRRKNWESLLRTRRANGSDE